MNITELFEQQIAGGATDNFFSSDNESQCARRIYKHTIKYGDDNDWFLAFSTDWAQGGPISEREKITLEWTGEGWNAYIRHDDEYPDGPTPLIAAMRCYVASKLGDEITIPKELT